ncbi:alpha/beta hydrolase [Thalassomonas viridans]|uniref:Alpha/beta hydrolase n=1 Tax=Thalassomonas viridans TaxID=137584 RepID=A0AAF0CC86_9GAMM|nr:alpha/beta hydrolase [Thalassomonas viridans]WDE07921.1 alpha/beta hydrolase [Thalassomonas viridans]
MIYVFSNRNIENDNWLGDEFNAEGPENIRVAKYNADTDKKLTFYPETDPQLLPSLKVIQEVEASDKPCCIFLHGFNQSLKKNLGKCEEIESYGVNVIAFSWPSNPGPQAIWRKIREYKRAVRNAERSSLAFERFFNLFDDYVDINGRFNNIKAMVVHSLGNYLLQHFVQGSGFENQPGFLNNILLHQADVNSHRHELWADKLAINSRVMATVNETDNTLDFSDVLNPDRLGNTLGNLNSERLQYFNFGKIPQAEDEHRLWIEPTVENASAKSFFESVFKGKKVNTGHFEFDRSRNCFHIK